MGGGGGKRDCPSQGRLNVGIFTVTINFQSYFKLCQFEVI